MRLLTKEQHQLNKNAKICYIKGKRYLKVRDLCHYTGEYRGAVHIIFNLKCSVPKTISVVFIMDQTIVIIFS